MAEANRIKKMREADELLYRDDQDTFHPAKEIIMYGGEDQVLLDCFGPWKLVKFEDVFLPSEVYDID
ncbi:hypothetical protein P5F80_10575 [Shouchella clausii]|uniref:hypothetical protein n=1 Tax=Shouchella clausii TaxID=79880 RepID=UPI002E22CF50|nr:hypothetical protein [Shouchella clausii]MED4176969.1 hypothetical protein [Shouchella clausii]